MSRVRVTHRLDLEVGLVQLLLWTEPLHLLQELGIRLVEVRVGDEDWCT